MTKHECPMCGGDGEVTPGPGQMHDDCFPTCNGTGTTEDE